MSNFDYVFITHLPAFYKVNLYNELAKHCRVYVIFVSTGSVIRNNDFTQGECRFDFTVLNRQVFEERNYFKSLFCLYLLLRKLHYKRLVVGGWDLPEFWFAIFYSQRKKNALVLESSLYECVYTGIKGWIKKCFIKKLSVVFASGAPHCELLQKLGFKGSVKKTLGVGILHYAAKPAEEKNFSGKFLYVGRLAPEKNLQILIDVFNQLPQYSLSIIGDGPLRDTYQNVSSNIRLLGYVPNQDLAIHYRSHDVFILPSLKEPWGLVVEEALYYELPVLASTYVGCSYDLVQKWQVGMIFDPRNKVALRAAILNLDYAFYKDKVQQVDFIARDNHQVAQYLEVLK